MSDICSTESDTLRRARAEQLGIQAGQYYRLDGKQLVYVHGVGADGSVLIQDLFSWWVDPEELKPEYRVSHEPPTLETSPDVSNQTVNPIQRIDLG